MSILQSSLPCQSRHRLHEHQMQGHEGVDYSLITPFSLVRFLHSISPSSKPLINNSAVPIFVARGIEYTSHNLTSAVTSGSWGWEVNGSRKKKTASILFWATIAPICWSPPRGPDWNRVIVRPVASLILWP